MDTSIKTLATESSKPIPSNEIFDTEHDNVIRIYNCSPLTIEMQIRFHGKQRSNKTFKSGRQVRGLSSARVTIEQAKKIIIMLQIAISEA